ncbi:hypothetical protein V3C99_011408 [Haemonchus contortus]|uniref:Apple domain-containing protein n=1 Tax=Haemonchus contortus TaxID=6289 RepID=A0A7I4Y7L0_HAECO
MKFLPQGFRVSLVSLLILSQVDQMLFCTYTSFHPAQESFLCNQTTLNVQTPNTTGRCMKMCVEIPECVAVSIHNTSGNFLCYLWKASQQVYEFNWNPGEVIFDLDRSTTVDSCPLAASLFPAS